MADTEDDLLKEAIANTENEIFSEAVGKDLPSTEGGPGDRSVEEMGEGLEGQLEADEAGSDVEAAGEGESGENAEAAEGKDGDGRDPKTGQFTAKADDKDPKDAADQKAAVERVVDDGKPKPRVPLNELTTERTRRQAAEARVKELETARENDKKTSADDLARINARLDALASSRQPVQPQQQAEAPAKKDIFEDPDGYIAEMRASIERDVTQKFVAADLARTAEAHGEKFEKAYTALTSLDKNDPAARLEVQRIWNSPTPGADLIKWHARQEVQRVVGADPEAYAKRIETETREKLAKDPEFRKALLAEMQTEARAGEGGTPRHIARMPRSLNGAAGGQSQGGGGGAVDGSDRGVFEDAFR